MFRSCMCLLVFGVGCGGTQDHARSESWEKPVASADPVVKEHPSPAAIREPEPAPPPEPTPFVDQGALTAEWQCTGKLRSSQVQSVVDAARPAVQQCYVERVVRDRIPEVKLRLTLSIDKGGTVQGTRPQDNLNDPDILRCVENVAKNQMKFPRVRQGNCLVVSAPYTVRTTVTTQKNASE